MADQNISLAVTGRNEAKRALNDVINDLGRTQKAVNNTAGSTKKMQDGFKGVGRGAGMAGIQIQQFVGQLQGGVNPMVALSQQSADLGFALGVPLVGAVVSIAAALSTMLIPSLLQSSEATKDLRDQLKDLVPDLEDMTPEELALSVGVLTDAIDEQSAVLTTNKFAIQAQKEIIEEANKEIATGKSNILGEVNARKAAQEEIERLNAERLIELRRLRNLQEELKSAENAMSGFNSKVFEGFKTLKDANIETRKFIRTTAGLEGIFPTALVTDEDPVQDISNIWKETDKFTVSQQRLGEATKMTAMTLEDVQGKAFGNMENSLTELIEGTKSVSQAFKDMARSVISDLIRMYVQQRITAPLFNAMFGQTPTTYTTIAPAGPPTVGGTEAFFEGGGYTGNGHRVGGVDGRGGFPAILHPNETVIDHTKGGGRQPTNVTVNVTTGVQQTVRAEIMNLLPQITNAAKAAVAQERQRGGSFSAAMGT